jgi:mannitol/fructose-specific phosphotransferase system IIA component (Ntr-type)
MIPPEAIIYDLTSTDKPGVLREMVDTLVRNDDQLEGAEVNSVVGVLMAREELGSTGIGKGFAVPHARHEGVKGLVAAFGRSAGGIDFASLDGQPVHLVFLLLSPKDSSGQHLEALARAAKLARDGRLCRILRNARDAKELLEILQEADAQLDMA